jgi:hypothetical protein
MKRVFSKSADVIHCFAQQMQNEGRNSSSSVFFETSYNSYTKAYGTKLYSYGHHYLLAEFLDANTIFINDDGYSVTTSKHISEVSYGTRQYKQFFKSKSDLETVYNTVISCKNKLARARKPELYINTILQLWESLNEFLVHTKAKKYKSNSMYKEIKKIVSLLNEDVDTYKEKLKELAIKKAKADKLKAKKELKINLEKFFNYEIDFFRINNSDDYLRISKDGNFIETSQSVKVDLQEAKILYKLIKAGKDIKGHKIGYYTVISINGTLKIGCHNINTKNMHEIGEKILKM